MSESIAFGQAGLTDCDREAIHTPGSIQPHGALIALDPGTLRIVQAGGATQRFFGVPPEALLGQAAEVWLKPAELEQMRAALNEPGARARPVQAFSMAVPGETLTADAMVHHADGHVILELEPAVVTAPHDPLSRVQTMIRGVQDAGETTDAAHRIAAEVRALAGFDRVMIYRFLEDGSGAVIAEARDAALEPYLGLRYPASDIPQQARALYLRNWLRLIPDAAYTPAPLVGLAGEGARPLDLSLSVLRSVSPIHVEYLQNMGVAASMSMSIIIDGKLWGFIACHHLKPRFLAYRLRIALELFAQMASFHLKTKTTEEDFGLRLRSKTLQEEMIADLAQGAGLTDSIGHYRARLLEYIPASGLGLWIDGRYTAFGTALGEAEMGDLVAWLNAHADPGVFETDCLSQHMPAAAAWARVASGVLAVPVSRSPRDYIVWFRPEQPHTVTWAGDPAKSRDSAARISPRKSFAAWRQEVRLRSAPWSDFDVKTAQSLRVSLLEVVLHHIDQIAR